MRFIDERRPMSTRARVVSIDGDVGLGAAQPRVVRASGRLSTALAVTIIGVAGIGTIAVLRFRRAPRAGCLSPGVLFVLTPAGTTMPGHEESPPPGSAGLSLPRSCRRRSRNRPPRPPAPPPPFTIVEASIADMRAAMEQRRVTSRELVQQYLLRIATYEERLNAVIAVNPTGARGGRGPRPRARAGQGARAAPRHSRSRSRTTSTRRTCRPPAAPSRSRGLIPPYEATLTKNLRDAGAIIIAKTVMTELANWVASGMPGNYSALGGYGMNPYDPRRDPREATGDGRPVMGTGGSSSGIGTAASFWAANVGTETSGSILSPASANMLVGIKPTVGRISRYGVIPITADQDTPGPMARSVADAAILLGALESAAPDPNDAATKTCAPPPGRDYTKFLNPAGLKGARIGIPRAFFYDRTTPPGASAAARRPQSRRRRR